MNKKIKPWLLVGFVLLTFGLVGGLGLAYVNANQPETSPTPSPSATETKTDAQLISENTVNLFVDAVMGDVVNQTSAEDTQEVAINTETSNIAADGTPASVATLTVTELPEGVDVKKNIEYLKNLMIQVNKAQQTSWVALEAEDEFADQPDIVGAVKLWEEDENPANPAIVDILYFNTDNKLSVTVTATVYLGKQPTTTDE